MQMALPERYPGAEFSDGFFSENQLADLLTNPSEDSVPGDIFVISWARGI